MTQDDMKRIQISLTDADLEMVDEWRFENRVPTRVEAIRRLLRLGATGCVNEKKG